MRRSFRTRALSRPVGRVHAVELAQEPRPFRAEGCFRCDGELGRVYRAHLPINATPTAFAAALEGLQPPTELPWQGETPLAHADFLAWTDKPTTVPGPVNLGEIVAGLRDRLPVDTVICNGAGNFSIWVHRYTRYRRYGTELAPISGSMGYGVPAAIGMKRLAPERTVVALRATAISS